MVQKAPTDVRSRLLAAAFEAATHDGVESISTRAVCAAAGVQAPTFYHYFGDRSGLIRAVVDEAFERYFARKDLPIQEAMTPRERVAAGWDTHIAFARSFPGLYAAMYPISGPLPARMQESAALLRAGFDELQQLGALTTGVTAELATSALQAALRGVAYAASNPGQTDIELVSTIVRDALIDKLIVPEGEERP
ncbi:TetR/AcrR family transcriptional regulator (plasmid) [Deinococcus radiomollis]|uniref:TetR/AcrR family transcriptional regulator n=1 Tax=Deinococcus radiomollis TaxID=468916 RepID=UPI003892628B